MNDKQVSIVICTLNRGQYLERCLYCLSNQTFSDFNVVVVDQTSKDKTEDVINKWKNKLDIKHLKVETDGYSSPSKYRNIGWKATFSKYVVFTDPENLIPFDCLEKSFKYHESNQKCITAYKPIMVSKDITENILLEFKYESLISNLFNKDLMFFDDEENLYIKVRKSWRDNHFSMMLRSALEEIGGVNEKFDKWGFEGIDLVERIMGLGYKLYNFSRNDFVYHLWHEVKRDMKIANKQRVQFGIKGCGTKD